MSIAEVTEFDEEEGDNRPSCYYEGQTLIIRASALGNSCLFELVAAAQLYDPVGLPAVILRAFEEGKKIEPTVIKRLQTDHGMVIHSRQHEGELVLPNDIVIRFHPDAILSWPRYPNISRWVGEVKALTNSSWMRALKGSVGDIVDEYNWQLSVMMLALQMPGLWVPYNKGLPPDPETGIRPFCKNEKALYLEPVYDPPISLDQINEKAQHIKELVDGDDVLESGEGCTDPSHWPCRFQHIRPEAEEYDGVDNPEVLKVTPDSDLEERVNYLVTELQQHNGQIAESKAKVDDAKEELIRISNGHKRIQTSKWLVPIVNGSNSSLDRTDMPHELKEALKAYSKKTYYKYIRGIKRLD